jgi:hypothetical protein
MVHEGEVVIVDMDSDSLSEIEDAVSEKVDTLTEDDELYVRNRTGDRIEVLIL